MFGQGWVEEDSIGEAWESLVKECWTNGRTFETEYGEKSKDLSPGIAYVIDPLAEPRIHRAVFAWHRKDEYLKEILEGVKDDRIGKDWWYSYHQRLFRWPWLNNQVQSILYDAKNDQCTTAMDVSHLNPNFVWVNQVKYIIKKLKSSSYSRRAQAITWNPLIDETSSESPCLQRIWCRIATEVGEPSVPLLEMHTYWRSRDLWKAWWLNVYGMVGLQFHIAEELGVGVGRYIDVSSSLHIYERDWEQVEGHFMKIVDYRPYKERYHWPKEDE